MMEEASEAAQYYWTHQFLASFLLGIGCFLLGLIVGAVLWAGRKKKSLKLEAKNEELRREISALEDGESAAATPK